MEKTTEEIIAFILDFDDKDIIPVFIAASGRSGSMLLQSLLDNHPQILMFPQIISIYFDWDDLKELKNPKKFLENFFSNSSFTRNWLLQFLMLLQMIMFLR